MQAYNFSILNDKKCIILCGDSRKILASLKGCVDLIVTSPPYADARSKHYDSVSPDKFADWLTSFHSVLWECLKPQGSLLINIKDKVVNGVRHRFVWHTIERLSQLGWLCIDDYVWHKANAFPGYWPNRFRDSWEYVFHLSKTLRPFMQQDAVKIPIGNWIHTRLKNLTPKNYTRNTSGTQADFGCNLSHWIGKQTALPTNVLHLPTANRCKGHPAVFPTALPTFFIKLFSPPNGLILDPFGGSGSTAIAAAQLHRRALLIDNQKNYCDLAYQRLLKESSLKKVDIFYPLNS